VFDRLTSSKPSKDKEEPKDKSGVKENRISHSSVKVAKAKKVADRIFKSLHDVQKENARKDAFRKRSEIVLKKK